ncbi:aldehyde dehydrogenase family protein [Acidovorax citrulli]|nr:aldehyde dehydrogenase family protein [Paracidovorax citrulli]MVT37092.1 aldehyde dehydrogenase family protein [Paracidovorax citrulli]UMT82362.1 aldehyde dehydrogenase family protein [Paracidovorax citrulli]SDJ83507.1 Aldehyde dehydrogenase family protein [Paracidovorax citrulli]
MPYSLAGQGAIVSKFCSAGQTCVCANRIYVPAGVYGASWESWPRPCGA